MSVRVRPYRRGGWEVDVIILLPNGKTIRERKKAPVASKSGAQRWGEVREQEIFRNVGRPVYRVVPTLQEFAPRFLAEYCSGERHKASGIQRKEIALRVHLLPLFGRKRLDEIDNQDVQRLKLRLAGSSASNVNNVLTTLNKLLKVAVEWDVMERMACSIKLLPRPEKEAEFWDFPEFERLASASESIGPNAQLVVLLGGLAGLRMGEIIALRWSDVDLDRAQLWVRQNDWRGHVDRPKGGRSGMVDLCQRLEFALRAHQAHSRLRSRDGRVLCREDGSSLTERSVRSLVDRVERLAGLPPKGVHALRHTFGAHLAMRGASPKAIQELMRHEDLAMTQRYTHLSPAARESAVRLLDEPIPFRRGDVVETALLKMQTASP